MATYTAPLRDMRFVLHELLDAGSLAQLPGYEQATPDLIDDLPSAAWAPLAVDVDAWASDVPVMQRTKPKVLHGPSQRWTKGTDRILPALTALHDKGAIELVLAERVSWDEMRELVRTSDIVVDQFAVGSYGTFAVEAMAAGNKAAAVIRLSDPSWPSAPYAGTLIQFMMAKNTAPVPTKMSRCRRWGMT